jgi:hypothetical protein
MCVLFPGILEQIENFCQNFSPYLSQPARGHECHVSRGGFMSAESPNKTTGGPIWVPAILPDGGDGFTPCPEILTEEEAIRYLRLDKEGPRYPANTLKYYRDIDVLRGVRIGRHMRYPRRELDAMVERLLEESP